MKQFSIAYKINTVLLALLFSFICYNTNVNRHTHIVNGKLYQHSHFVKKQKNQNKPTKHKHNEEELKLLSYVSNIGFDKATSVNIPSNLSINKELIIVYLENYKHNSLYFINNKAPTSYNKYL